MSSALAAPESRIAPAGDVQPGGVSTDLLTKATMADNTNVLARSGVLGNGRGKFSVSPDLVKGIRDPGQKEPDYDQVSYNRELLAKTWSATMKKGWGDPLSGLAGVNPMFAGPLSSMISSSPSYRLSQLEAELGKNFTTSSPLASGLVPFDLVAPTLLIYPVYTPFRNRFPRPQGQGLSHRAKVLTQIQGSQPGQFANSSLRTSITELNGGTIAGNWPISLPAAGSQTSVDVNINYKFFGLSESTSWLAQWAGQGFDDVAALANLVLLQEFMLGEERQLISGTSVAIGTGASGVALHGNARSAGTGETGITGFTTGVYLYATTVNYYGETAVGNTSGLIGLTGSTQVIDLTMTSVPAGGLAHNIYVATGTSDPGSAAAHLWYSNVGGSLLTLQGPIPTTTATPPLADTGSSAATDYEGLVSILSGHAAPSIYPTGYQGGYINLTSGSQLRASVIEAADVAVYDASSSNYFADPAEIWCEASDIRNLADDLASSTGKLSYEFFVNQGEMNDVTAGIAVSQFTNPVTRSKQRLTVHPYMPQGTILGLSYTLPVPQSNISNVWEVVCVQDYLAINWPVVDVTFRFSMFMYNTLFTPAPQYNFIVQGLQKHDTTPYS